MSVATASIASRVSTVVVPSSFAPVSVRIRPSAAIELVGRGTETRICMDEFRDMPKNPFHSLPFGRDRPLLPEAWRVTPAKPATPLPDLGAQCSSQSRRLGWW
jgi:hypothetical protein